MTRFSSFFGPVGLTLLLSAFSTNLFAKEFRLGLITPPAHEWSKAADRFANALDTESKGEHRVVVYPAAQLGNEAQMVQQLQTGALDMAFLTVAEISNRVPEFGAWYAPYLVKNIDEAAALLQSDTAKEMFSLLPQQAGLIGVGYGMAGMRQIMSRSAVTSPADLQGQKIRITPFEPIRDFYNALNTAPTPLPLPAVYDALANRQIDAIDMDFDSILIFKFYERAEHMLITNHMMFPMVGVVSARVWSQMSDADRAMITQLMNAELAQVIEIFRQQEHEQEAELRALDITITDLDPAIFTDAVTQWEAIWAPKSSYLNKLRATVEALSP